MLEPLRLTGQEVQSGLNARQCGVEAAEQIAEICDEHPIDSLTVLPRRNNRTRLLKLYLFRELSFGSQKRCELIEGHGDGVGKLTIMLSSFLAEIVRN